MKTIGSRQGSGGERMINYVINLDVESARMASVQARFDQLGIPINRISAVDGRTFSATKVAGLTTPIRNRPGLTPGELGCFLSHRAAWEALLDSGEPFAAVFEDDVLLSEASKDFLTDTSWIPPDFGIIKLETSLNRIRFSKTRIATHAGRNLHQLHGFHTGTAGYIIERDFAARLLAESRKIGVAVDVFLFSPEYTAIRTLKAAQLVPALCAQEDMLAASEGRASIHPSRLRAERTARGRARSRLTKAKTEILRPFRQLAKLADELTYQKGKEIRAVVDFA